MYASFYRKTYIGKVCSEKCKVYLSCFASKKTTNRFETGTSANNMQPWIRKPVLNSTGWVRVKMIDYSFMSNIIRTLNKDHVPSSDFRVLRGCISAKYCSILIN